MRILIRWAARLYPARWRNRYAAEFDALLDDISPSLGDVFDVIVDVFRVRVTTSDACLAVAPVSQMSIRVPVVISLGSHALIIILSLWAAFSVTQIPLFVPIAPLPPPAPEPPPLVTDARIFPNALTVYSSLPLRTPSRRDALRLYVANGVGINFLSLPDTGARYRQEDIERRVWPGQALEAFIVRRVLPEYPHGTNARGAVSVIVQYLVSRDGSVKVLLTSGPMPFTRAAQSAIEKWLYRPLRYENHPCEVVSRVEVRFDSELAQAGMTP
jgi:hypothetical protein